MAHKIVVYYWQRNPVYAVWVKQSKDGYYKIIDSAIPSGAYQGARSSVSFRKFTPVLQSKIEAINAVMSNAFLTDTGKVTYGLPLLASLALDEDMRASMLDRLTALFAILFDDIPSEARGYINEIKIDVKKLIEEQWESDAEGRISEGDAYPGDAIENSDKFGDERDNYSLLIEIIEPVGIEEKDNNTEDIDAQNFAQHPVYPVWYRVVEKMISRWITAINVIPGVAISALSTQAYSMYAHRMLSQADQLSAFTESDTFEEA